VGNPADQSARADADRHGTIVGSELDRTDAALIAERGDGPAVPMTLERPLVVDGALCLGDWETVTVVEVTP